MASIDCCVIRQREESVVYTFYQRRVISAHNIRPSGSLLEEHISAEQAACSLLIEFGMPGRVGWHEQDFNSVFS